MTISVTQSAIAYQSSFVVKIPPSKAVGPFNSGRRYIRNSSIHRVIYYSHVLCSVGINDILRSLLFLLFSVYIIILSIFLIVLMNWMYLKYIKWCISPIPESKVNLDEIISHNWILRFLVDRYLQNIIYIIL